MLRTMLRERWAPTRLSVILSFVASSECVPETIQACGLAIEKEMAMLH